MQRIRYISGRYMDINATYYTILAVSITQIKLILRNPTCIVFSRLHIIVPIVWIWTDNLPFVVETKGIRLLNNSITHDNLQYVHTYGVVSLWSFHLGDKNVSCNDTYSGCCASDCLSYLYHCFSIFIATSIRVGSQTSLPLKVMGVSALLWQWKLSLLKNREDN